MLTSHYFIPQDNWKIRISGKIKKDAIIFSNGHFQRKGEFMIGTVGFQDVNCKTINVTYVKVFYQDLISNLISFLKQTESVELHATLLEYVKQFRKQYTNGGSKTINLEVIFSSYFTYESLIMRHLKTNQQIQI